MAIAKGKDVADELQKILVDLIGLSLQTKQAHWNVTGPFFSPLHELFDGMTDSYRGWYDEVAERILALGFQADGRLSTVAATTKLKELPEGAIQDRKAVDLLLAHVEGTIGRIRGVLDKLGAQDSVTQDMVIGIVEGLEKQAWMLRVQQS